MAARSLREAILKALSIGPLSEVQERLEKELRDFFAHKAQIFDAKQSCAYCEGKTIEFFNEVFKDISALRTKPNTK